MVDIFEIHSTFATRDEADLVAEQLVEARLAACVNIYTDATSLYRWQGLLHREKEVIFIAKTSKKKLEQAIDFIKKHHSYDLPAITAHPISDGFAPYLQWVEDETT